MDGFAGVPVPIARQSVVWPWSHRDLGRQIAGCNRAVRRHRALAHRYGIEEFGCKSMAGKQLLSMNLAWGDWQGPLRRGFGLMGSGA
jgi:hypothetical protein